MKQAKVLKTFTDRDSGQVFRKGDTYTGPPERVVELRGAGVLEAGEVEPDGIPADERQGESPATGKPASGTGSAGTPKRSGAKRTRPYG